MQRFGPRTRYRLGTSSMFIILYRYFVIYQENEKSPKMLEKKIPESIPLFDKEKWLEKWKKLYQNIENDTTKNTMQKLYNLFLERIVYTYGKQYTHMTLQEIQSHQGLTKDIIHILAQLYMPIYNQQEYDKEKQKKIATELKKVISSFTTSNNV